MKDYQLFIGGECVDPVNGEWFETVDPYRGEAWARIPRGTAGDVDRAVMAAGDAMWRGPWTTMSATARGKVMRKLGDLVAENAERLAEIEVRDNGKLKAEMLAQVRYHSEWWWYYAGLVDKLEGKLVPIDKPDMFAFTTQEPVGVVGALTAWNSPLLFVAWKCAAAIAAGCAVIVKPSEFASASTLEFARLTREAGLPDGMFNVVTGFGQEAGSAIVSHPGIDKITFTGSDATGARINELAARHLKRVSLELGGKSPNIIFEDADIDAAVAGAISGIFAATGQTCIAGSRLLLQNSIRDEVVSRLVEIAGSATLGDPMNLETNIGPVTTPAQYRKVLDYIDIARSEGARCVFGGKAASGEHAVGGQFVEPTIFVDVTNDMRIAREEVFGPVLSVIGFDTEDEAVQIANDTIYGLAAGVWTQDFRRILRLPKLLRAGTVWVNTYRAVSYMMPFGGMKHSGIGRESGIDAVSEYLEKKSVWISTARDAPANPFVIR
ncbi:aldehyde dehydrogenase [Microbaculum marinum]|uniref:Aldehyde dehydrogenase n=1 Tax=Microbaculum marinum TaxID=1764581 RepID=A0AAW9RKZ5_9HYPH